MQDIESSEYFLRRAGEERAAAQRATDERAALTHDEMARRYEEVARNGVLPAQNEPMDGILARDLQIFP